MFTVPQAQNLKLRITKTSKVFHPDAIFRHGNNTKETFSCYAVDY